MEEAFTRWAELLSLLVEAAAAVLIAIGATDSFILALRSIGRDANSGIKREAWRRLARWLVLALEFELAADVVRTAISPTWDDIGQLGAIAVIRTFLNFFLERDLESMRRVEEEHALAAQARAQAERA